MPGSRRPIIGGNWKMNTTLEGAVALAESLVRAIETPGGVDVVLFPPFPNLDAVYHVINGTALQLGGQNVFWEDSGAYTGEVSAPMLLGVGCTWVIVGHSERRHILGESDETVNRKLRAALHHEMSVTLAVGETRDERHADRTHEVLERQLRGGLHGVRPEDMDRVVIAYEPVWAIGTGETATREQAQGAHAFVRQLLAALYGGEIAGATRIQYGGSVTAANAETLMGCADVDGALVGGASLKPADFAGIVRAAAMGV